MLSASKSIVLIRISLKRTAQHYPSFPLTGRFIPHGHNESLSKICLMSYPRSGNSFLRSLLEKSTGYVTGSDSRPNRTLTSRLLRCGFIGEGIIDDSVEIVKSHYPERLGYVKFVTDCVVLLVRNPFESLESYFHMGMTNTHDKSLSVEVIIHCFIENEIFSTYFR